MTQPSDDRATDYDDFGRPTRPGWRGIMLGTVVGIAFVAVATWAIWRLI